MKKDKNMQIGANKVFPLLDGLFFDWIANNFFIGMTLFDDAAILDDVMGKNREPIASNESCTTVLPQDLDVLGSKLRPEDTVGEIFGVGMGNPLLGRETEVETPTNGRFLQGMWFTLNWKRFAAPACKMAANFMAGGREKTEAQVLEPLTTYKNCMCSKYKSMTMLEAIRQGTAYVEGPPRWGMQTKLVLDKFSEKLTKEFAKDDTGGGNV